MKKILIVLLTACVLVGCQSKKDENVIRIACNMPMTGPIGYIGDEVRCGLDMAIEDKQYDNIVVEYQDNMADNKNAVAIVNKQLLKRPHIYMSSSTSQTMVIKDLISKENVPHFLWSFTPLQLSKHDGMYRSLINLGVESKYILDFVDMLKPRRVYFIYANTIGTKEQCESIVVPTIKTKYSDMLIKYEAYDLAETSFKNLVLKIKEFNADAIIVEGYKEHIMSITKEMKNYGLNLIPTYYSFDIMDAAQELDATLVEGAYVAAPNFYLPELQNNAYKIWSNAFVQKYKRSPKYYAAYAYDLIEVIQQVFELIQEQELSFNEALQFVDFEGITGRVSFDENGELKYNLRICQYHDGILLPIQL